MATQQSTQSHGKKAPSKSGKASGTKAPSRGARASDGTSERDDTYGLISVVYHSLQGAETCTQYIEDARQAGHEELATFFEECRDEQNRRALLGRRILATELQDIEEDSEDMLEDDDADA